MNCNMFIRKTRLYYSANGMTFETVRYFHNMYIQPVNFTPCLGCIQYISVLTNLLTVATAGQATLCYIDFNQDSPKPIQVSRKLGESNCIPYSKKALAQFDVP